MVINVKSPI